MEKINFEQSLKELEEIVKSLESGTISLDESLEYFEKGINLVKLLENQLKNVEERAVKIIENVNQE
ncbi:MAG: exodeoxyribonuclease VII small subunit [Bacilli bacterium]|nr:exodeoxyribonuclease VII small subunit [Bacilli bacterium]